MIMNDSYLFLFDAGWLFFAAWTAVIGALSLMAFRNDLFPAREPIESSDPARPPKRSRPA
jgi:hypothetical protein